MLSVQHTRMLLPWETCLVWHASFREIQYINAHLSLHLFVYTLNTLIKIKLFRQKIENEKRWIRCDTEVPMIAVESHINNFIYYIVDSSIQFK